MSDPYLGEIRMAGFNFAPQGWALCQGQVMSLAQNQALFALLGTTYGGNGVQTFGLPDLRGRSPVGFGEGPGLSNIVLGEVAGTETVTLNQNQLPMHNHAVTVTPPAAVTAPINIPASTATTGQQSEPSTNTVLGTVNTGGRASNFYVAGDGTTTLKPFNVTVNAGAPTVAVQQAGASQPFSLRNPYLGVNFIIALQGIFPTRG
ncbi:phage tail protein [Paraburkholderia bannensis]|uniref:phage tail protein n=1 Tax=Paraburkholderia bannensis TaxID=765414 RepID=UPI002AB72E69|nr:tail fiber protein [Paraburkholderia bannensis]